MREIESKFLEVDVQAIRKKLLQLGAQKTFDGIINSTNFDFSDLRLKKAGKLIRLRTRGDIVELTYKHSLPSPIAKESEEWEIQCNNYDAIVHILQAVGLEDRKNFLSEDSPENRRKHRESYSVGKTHFELDTFDGIPTFLEIEAESIEAINEWAEKLALSPEEGKPWTGKDVLRHYGKLPPQ